MIKENNKSEKLCMFFASDYHFEMISLPYINENLKKNINVIMMTENDLNNSVDRVLKNIEFSVEEKNKLNKVDWESNDLNKFKKIKNAKEEGKETIIFVKGTEKYINCINKNIENWINVDDVKVIDCYDINEVQNQVEDITRKYNKILLTSGVEKLL